MQNSEHAYKNQPTQTHYDALRRNESSDAPRPSSFHFRRAFCESQGRDAERPKTRYDAERRNEGYVEDVEDADGAGGAGSVVAGGEAGATTRRTTR
jgi:hypothetical protein